MAAGLPQIIIYEDFDFMGRSQVFNGQTPVANPLGGDVASSVVVVTGDWQLFEDIEYQGKASQIIGPGRYPKIDKLGISNDSMSSLKPV